MDTAHVLANLAIAAICIWILVKLRAPRILLGTAILFVFFLPGLPLILVPCLLGWRAVRRQPLGGPRADEIEQTRKQHDDALDHLAGV